MSIGFITHFSFRLHDMGQGHPESPQRLSAIEDALIAARLMDFLTLYEAPMAEDQDILLVHDQEYLQYLKKQAPEKGLVSLDVDTALGPHSLQAAYRAVGAAVMGVDLLMKGEVKHCFCAVRPPGHHAERDRAMGFCVFNNLAIAAAYALKVHALKRIVVIDFDVHHGNGTEQMLANDERVLICSSFQHPFYPGKPFSAGSPRVINIPLPAHTDSATFRQVISEQWFPAIRSFQPELIFVSAGFDAHQQDPLAGLNLTTRDFAWLGEQIRVLADESAQGRVLSTLEGGYNLQALGESVVAYLRPFLGL